MVVEVDVDGHRFSRVAKVEWNNLPVAVGDRLLDREEVYVTLVKRWDEPVTIDLAAATIELVTVIDQDGAGNWTLRLGERAGRVPVLHAAAGDVCKLNVTLERAQ